MNIVILGGSNSAVSRAYADALGLRHEVGNFSLPAVPVSYHIGSFLRHQERLAQADVVILEHALDDMIAVGEADQSRLLHVENLYRMLAALGRPVLNLIAPAQDRQQIDAGFASALKDLSERHGFWLLDLNNEEFGPRFFADDKCLKRHVSHTFGILLGDLLETRLAELDDNAAPARQANARNPILEQVSGLPLVRKFSRKPSKPATVLSCPYRLLDARTIFADKAVAGAAFARAERSYIGLRSREKFFIGIPALADQQLLAVNYSNQALGAATLLIEIDQQKIDVAIAGKCSGNHLLAQSPRFGEGVYLSASFAEPDDPADPQEVAVHDLLLFNGTELQVQASASGGGLALSIPALLQALGNSMSDDDVAVEPEVVPEFEAALEAVTETVTEPLVEACVEPADTLVTGVTGETDQPLAPSLDPADVLAAALAEVPAEFINVLRDAAIDYEARNLSTSYALMNIAKFFRPKGPVILRKIAEYEEAMKKAESPKV